MAITIDVKRLKGDIPTAKSPGRPRQDYVKLLAPLRRSPGKPFVIGTSEKPADAAAQVGLITNGLYRQNALGYTINSRTLDGVPTVVGVYNDPSELKVEAAPRPAPKPEKVAKAPKAEKVAKKVVKAPKAETVTEGESATAHSDIPGAVQV